MTWAHYSYTKKRGVVFVISEMHFKSTDLPNILLSAEILPLDCTSFRYAAYKKIFRWRRKQKTKKTKDFLCCENACGWDCLTSNQLQQHNVGCGTFCVVFTQGLVVPQPISIHVLTSGPIVAFSSVPALMRHFLVRRLLFSIISNHHAEARSRKQVPG